MQTLNKIIPMQIEQTNTHLIRFQLQVFSPAGYATIRVRYLKFCHASLHRGRSLAKEFMPFFCFELA